MKSTVLTAAAVLLAGAAHAQTAPASGSPASDLTRDLNSRPPTIDEYLARPAAPVTPPAAATTAPAPRPATPEPTTARPAPAATAPSAARPAPAAPATTPPAPSPARPVATPTPAAPATTASPVATRPAPTTPAATTRPSAPPPEAPAASPAPPSAPAVTVLDAAARASLPFTVDLPSGFEIVTGRPGPNFRIFTIRRGGKSFAMIYVGPASQFPIYTGEMVEAAGRASVVTTEDGQRHAVEHLFQRPDAEVHVWTMSLEGSDRALAERIAQSVDVR